MENAANGQRIPETELKTKARITATSFLQAECETITTNEKGKAVAMAAVVSSILCTSRIREGGLDVPVHRIQEQIVKCVAIFAVVQEQVIVHEILEV